MKEMRYKSLIFPFLILSTIFARRLIEPEDIQPVRSLRNVNALEITEECLYAGMDDGVLRFYRFEDYVDMSRWESFYVPGEVLRITQIQDTIYVKTTAGIFSRRERDIFDVEFKAVSSDMRLPPDIGICDPYEYGVTLPFGLFWEGSDSILGPDMFFYRVTDCITDGSYYMYFSTDGLGVFRADLRNKVAEPLWFGPCCDYSDAVYFSGDTAFFGGCSDIEFCAFAMVTDDISDYEWIAGERSVSVPDYGPVLDFEKYGNEIYIATPRGLGLYDLDRRQWLRPTAKGSVPLYQANGLAIFRDTLYISSADGIYSMNLESRQLTLRSPVGLNRFADISVAMGKIIAVGDLGAYQFVDSQLIPIKPPDGHLDLNVRSVKPGEDGEALFATQNAVVVLEKAGTRKFIPSSVYFHGAEINDVESSRKYLWVATTHGLFVYHRFQKFATLLDEDYYFPDFEVYRVFLHGDYLWMSTDLGLYRFYWNEPDRLYR